jgi:hypothetical protein
MALRARKPEAVNKRLKLFMYGPAGVGKTTAALAFPHSYIIDCERGTENYDKLITANNSVVYQTVDVHECIAEVKALLTERHDFRTLVIDPITPIYNDLLEKMEARTGSDFGRHYGAANKEMKRLANLIMALDMNVVITAHAKTEYGENLKKLGYTFDGWRQLDYWFDLVIELGKRGKKRVGKVVKTRIETFPDEDVFDWSYDAIKARYDGATLERTAGPLVLAAPAQVAEVQALLNVVRLPDGLVEKWFSRANVDQWEDMPADALGKCIDYIKSRFPTSAAAGGYHEPRATNGNGGGGRQARHRSGGRCHLGAARLAAAARGLPQKRAARLQTGRAGLLRVVRLPTIECVALAIPGGAGETRHPGRRGFRLDGFAQQ